MAKKVVTNSNKSKNTDQLTDWEVVTGHDPFNGEVSLFYDGFGYWLENWRTNHYSAYLEDADGNLISDEAVALECFERERTNTQFSQPIYS